MLDRWTDQVREADEHSCIEIGYSLSAESKSDKGHPPQTKALG